MKPNYLFCILLIVLLTTGCASTSTEESSPTVTASIATATFPSTSTAVPSETPLPAPPQPTLTPVLGTASTQINVRAEPSTAGTILGILPANTKVEITGKDPGGNWWQILYPQGADGKGWVTAQYVTTADADQVPVVGGGEGPNTGNVAIVQQQINVRSGPGTGFNSLGTLNAQDVVNLTGKDANGAWLQIDFPLGPDGKGWINAAFVQARGVENVPIITEAGQVVGTGTPTGIPFTPTPTVVPALLDNDSQSSPIVNVVFDPVGTRSIIFSGDVSSPVGDAEDWIQFTPLGSTVFIRLQCSGGKDLQSRIFETGQPIPAEITCGEPLKALSVDSGKVYAIALQANQFSSGLQYVTYTITIQTSP